VPPGATQTVTLALAGRDLAYWDAGRQEFVLEPGMVRVLIGRSAADLQLDAVIEVVA